MGLFESKKKETWIADYEGHRIVVINSGKATLTIDGVEVDKEKNIISLACVLRGKIPGTDMEAVAFVNGADSGDLTCNIVVGNSVKPQHGTTNKDGEFTPFTPEEEAQRIKDDETAAILAATITTTMM